MWGGVRDYDSAEEMLSSYRTVRERLLNPVHKGVDDGINLKRPIARLVVVHTEGREPEIVFDGRKRWARPRIAEIPIHDNPPDWCWARDFEGHRFVLIGQTEWLVRPVVRAASDRLRDECAWLLDASGSMPRHPKDVMRRTADKHGMSIVELLIDRRALHIVNARCEAIYWVARLSTLSLPAIGRLFSDRDHTTIRNAISRHAKRSGLPNLNLSCAVLRSSEFAHQPSIDAGEAL